MQLTDAIRAQLQHLWDTAIVSDAHKGELLTDCQQLIANRSRYEAVSKQTGVPWYFIASVHMRESDCNFSTYLGNGDPLNRKTVHVPAGRGPWASWEAGAIDALKLESLDKITGWDIPTLLWHLELYNGMGYRNHGLPSPYVWSFTNVYTSGKYTADGVFDPYAVDRQAGCAAILIELFQLLSTQPMEAPMTATTPAIVTTTTNAVTAAVQSATLSIGSLWTQITGFIGSVAATGGLGIFATVAPTTTTAIMASIVAIATAVSAAAHVYSIVTGVSAANNATIMLVENFLNTVETDLGGKPLTFDNGTPAATA